MLTQSGNTYVIHRDVSLTLRAGTVTLERDGHQIETADTEFVEGVLRAAIRQGIPVNHE